MKKLLKAIFILIIYIAIIFIILWKSGIIEFKVIEKYKSADDYIDNGLSLEDENLIIEKEVEDKYYYNQLDTDAKKIYDKILESKENLKSGTEEFEFEENEFSEILSQENAMELLSQKFQEAVDAIRYDHVELYYIDFSKMVLRTITYTRGRDVKYEVFLSLMEGQESYLQEGLTQEIINNMEIELQTQSDNIINQASGTDYQKIQYIHNWLVDNLTYDTTYNKSNNRNIYGALINQDVVCEGYAKSFKYLLDKLEIPCILVSGDAVNSEGTTESHMWNYVRINDTWYSFDVTWDDPILTNYSSLPEQYRYRYFCQGDNINSNHTLTEELTEGGKKFIYPELYHKEE